MQHLTQKKRVLPEGSTYLGMFDYVKGIFIIAMILLHASGDYLHYWDYSAQRTGFALVGYTLYKLAFGGMIPMFFLICGYGYRKKKMKKAVEAQVKYLWKPYLLVALAVSALTVGKKALLHDSIASGLRYQALPYLFGLCPGQDFYGLYMDSIGPIWFFVTFIIAGILLNLVLQEKQFWIQCVLVVMLAVLGVQLKDISLPWCLQQSMICTGYMYAGWLMKKTNFFNMEVPVYFLIASVAFGAITAYTGYIEVSSNTWVNGVSDVFSGLLLGCLLLVICLRLNNRFFGKLAEKIRWLGREAMPFCSIHTVFYIALPWDKVAARLGWIGFLVAAAVYTITGIGGCMLINFIRKRA